MLYKPLQLLLDHQVCKNQQDHLRLLHPQSLEADQGQNFQAFLAWTKFDDPYTRKAHVQLPIDCHFHPDKVIESSRCIKKHNSWSY